LVEIILLVLVVEWLPVVEVLLVVGAFGG